jgi:YHYH protein
MKREFTPISLVFALAAIVGVRSSAQVRVRPSNSEAGVTRLGTNYVRVTVTGGERIVTANGWPDHTPGEFPRPGNPNSMSSQNYTFHLPANPAVAAQPTPAGHSLFGVALNGVPFDPGTAEFWNRDPRSGWNYEAKSGFINLGLDENNAHVQPTGAYHYHALPVGLVQKLGGDALKMIMVGYAADGFPIYTGYGYKRVNDPSSGLKKMHSSYRLKSGTRPSGPGGTYDGKFTADYEYVKGTGDLDECNGRFGVTPEYPQGVYHYYITDEFPWISRVWRGTPDPSFMKRAGAAGRPPGFAQRPP